MRHGVKGRKLGRTTAHRVALFRNQLQSLVDKERIITTLPKAKELRPLAEKVITRGKQGSLHARRWVLRWVAKRDLVKKVFDDLAPRFKERPGGYLRIVKLGPRQGDGAEMAVIEMVDRVETPKEKATAKEGAAPAKKGKSKPAKAAAGWRRGAPAKAAGAPAEAGEAGKHDKKGDKGGEGRKPTTPKPGGKKPPTRQKTG
ncbi:MAG TPA: 50S ribosomal protein L17 [Thermoanaerobaculia bacterium]|nr:50S ribosomal protein L17 [Thermoanaerobaculia bacterium]